MPDDKPSPAGCFIVVGSIIIAICLVSLLGIYGWLIAGSVLIVTGIIVAGRK